MKIDEIEGFPKALLKKKTLPLYKAFVIKDPDESMQINSSIDLLAITEEKAIETLLSSMSTEELEEWKQVDPNQRIISFAIFKLNMEHLKQMELVDHGDIFFEDNMISITLRDKLYTIAVKDVILDSFEYTIDEKTDKKVFSHIVTRLE